MARFCTACGHRLPAPDAPCPTCTGNGGDSLRADTSGDGRGKRISRKGSERRKKRRHIVVGLVVGLVTILAVVTGTLALLVHFRVFDLPLVNPPQTLQELSDARISVQCQDGEGRRPHLSSLCLTSPRCIRRPWPPTIRRHMCDRHWNVGTIGSSESPRRWLRLPTTPNNKPSMVYLSRSWKTQSIQ